MDYKLYCLDSFFKYFSVLFHALSLDLKQMQPLYLARVEISITSYVVVETGSLHLSLQHLMRNFPTSQNLRGHELFENSTSSSL
jgi:hypothetical protein